MGKNKFVKLSTLSFKVLRMATLAQFLASGLTIQDLQYELAHWSDDRGPLVITIGTIFIVCALTAVALRLYTRKRIVKVSWQGDDYAIVAAIVRSVPKDT